MDFYAEAGAHPTHTTVEGQAGEQGLPLSSTHCEAESGGTILLQLLEFKTHLLETVEELHIRRDAETRYEGQLSKLVLEKQELEWEKESLLKQIDTVANQNKESLINAKKQDKLKSTEEEKWKYQITAELKDKEIKNLKEELKSLQLLKYNLEKKSSELEQKLALQTRSKDSHLNQLGEVEKRFTTLSRQCAMIKQAHEKLEQNVNEAMSINRKLSSANEKQEATIDSLKKDLEELSKKQMKARMTSVTHGQTHSSTGKEQQIQQLHQKLHMETKMNKKLWEENESARAEKQEVIKSLQHSQNLLLSQTQTLSKVELELQTQRELYQALKQEHEMMREKSKALEDKVAQLMESYTASKTSWDKEKTVYLGHIKNEQQDLQTVKEAYAVLYQKHTKLSSRHEAQAQQIYEAEMKDGGQLHNDSMQVLPTLVEEVITGTSPNEPIPSSELCMLGSLQPVVSSLTKNPDCLDDTEAVTKLVATVEIGEQEAIYHFSQYQQSMCPLTNNVFSLGRHSGRDVYTNILNEFTCNSKKTGSDPDAVSNLGYTSLSVYDNNLHILQGNSLSRAIVSNPDHKTVYEYVDIVNKDKHQKRNVGRNEEHIRGQDDWKQETNNSKEEDRYTEQQRNRGELLGGYLKGRWTAEISEMLRTQTTDRADRQEDYKGSTGDTGDTRNPETETQDRVEGEVIDEGEKRGKTAANTSETPESQIWDQTTADSTIEKSNQQQVIAFMNTEPSLPVSVASNSSQSISVKVIDENFSYANKDWGDLKEEQLISNLNSVTSAPSLVIQEVQKLFCTEVQIQNADLYLLPNNRLDVLEKTTTEKKLYYKSAPEHSEPLNHPSICCTQKDAPLNTYTDVNVDIKEVDNSTASTGHMDPSDIKNNMKQTDDICNMNIASKSSPETRSLQSSPRISEQVNGQEEFLVTDDDSGNSSTSNGQSTLDVQIKSICQSVQKLEDVYSDVMNITELKFESSSSKNHHHRLTAELEDTKYAKTTIKEVKSRLHRYDEPAETGCPKSHDEPPAKQMLFDTTNGSYLHSTEIYRSSFDWANSQFFEGTEQHASWSSGNLRHASSTIPNVVKSKCNKVPLVITRASELLNASSVSGIATFSRRNPQGEWKAIEETCRETAAADTEKEEQQSSFRAQISKIEQFLKKDRLCLAKRQKNDS